MVPTTNATVTDARALVAAVSAAHGKTPDTLTNLLAAETLIGGQGGASDPAMSIVDAATNGTLTLYKLTGLVNESALASMRNSYYGDLRRRIGPLLTRRFHECLDEGAADEILTSLRPSFDAAAEAIDAAKSMGINATSTIEHIIASADSDNLVTAWKSLDGHIKTIASIAAIASQFGCGTARFPLIEIYSLADNYKVDGRALWCCDGPNLVEDSHPFGRPDQGHRSSPFFKTALRLHTVDSARDRYRQWASSEWQRIHSGPGTRWMDTAGNLREMPKPTNPYLQVAVPSAGPLT